MQNHDLIEYTHCLAKPIERTEKQQSSRSQNTVEKPEFLREMADSRFGARNIQGKCGVSPSRRK